MKAVQHIQIAERGIAGLSGDSFDFWCPQKELLKDASCFPDIFWPGGKSDPEYLRKYPDWRDCILIPVGNHKINCHSAFDTLRLEETYPPVLEFLVASAVSAIREENHERAAKFAGVLSHIIGDTGQAAHVCDPRLLAPLFQKDGDCYLIHTFLENNPKIRFPKHFHQAEPLGNSREEIQWRLLKRLQTLKRHSVGTVVPIMLAGLQNDWDEAGRHASETVAECADLFSDLLYSLFLAAQGRQVLSRPLSLLELEPEEYHCDGMFNFMPQKNFIPGNRFDQPVPLDVGRGAEKGFALLPDLTPGYQDTRKAFLDFSLPAKGFRLFSCDCGLNRRAPKNETAAVFRIFLDGKPVWESPELDAEAAPCHAEVRLNGEGRLRLQVQDARRDALETKFFHPCFIAPELIR